MKQNYYVFPPFEIFSQEELNERANELKRDGRKCIAVVFDCSSDKECSDRYFANLEAHGIDSPCSVKATHLIG